MKQLFIATAVIVTVLSGCAATEDPAGLITAKPDMARSAGLDSALKTVVSTLESTRTANGSVNLSNPRVEGYKTAVKPQGMGANYCASVTDNVTGSAKTYTSVDAKTIDGNNC